MDSFRSCRIIALLGLVFSLLLPTAASSEAGAEDRVPCGLSGGSGPLHTELTDWTRIQQTDDWMKLLQPAPPQYGYSPRKLMIPYRTDTFKTLPQGLISASGGKKMIRIQELGYAGIKTYIVHVGESVDNPITILRGTKAGVGYYAGEMKVGTMFKMSGLILTDGSFLVSHSSDINLLRLALGEANVTAAVGETTRIGEQVGGGFTGSVSPNASLTLDLGQVVGSPFHLSLFGGPEIRPKNHAAPETSLAAGGKVSWDF